MDYEADFRGMELQTGYGSIFCKFHTGQSPPIIFIHGLASNTRTWLRLMNALPPSLDVYLMDMLGHGNSEAPDINYTVDVQVGVLESLIEEKGLKDPYLFGHSYGGWVAAKYAESSVVKGLILEDAGGLEGFYKEVKGTDSREHYKEELLSKALMLDAKKHVIKSMLDDEFKEGQLGTEELGRIKAPTLIIWGEGDNVISPKFAKVFSEGIKESRVEIIKGARHTPHYTNPGEIAQLLLKFVHGPLLSP